MGILDGLYKWCASRLTSEKLAEVATEKIREDNPKTSERRDALEELAIALELEPDDVFYRPVETIEELDDDPEKVYLHVLEKGTDVGVYADRFDELFRQHYGHDTRGLHVPMTDLRELREADPAYIQQQAAPWLTERVKSEA